MDKPFAIVEIKPEQDKEVMAFYNEALNLAEYAEARIIATTEDTKLATNDLSLISKIRKALEEKRKGYVKPLQDKVKEINDVFKTLMLPIEIADSITRSKILVYQQEQDTKRKEQEEINRLRMEAARKEMELKGEITESIDLVEISPETPSTIRTDMGTSGVAKIRKWEVEDLSKVPLDYLMIDVAKVGKVVRAGIPSIAGIRIWDENILRVTPAR